MSLPRHDWTAIAPKRYPFKTERECARCGLIKVTRHENDRHWIEFWKDGEKVEGKATPPCVAK
jgi:hypothetical protein